jgi:hypothetical protein
VQPQTFSDFLERVHALLGKQLPKPNTQRVWFEEVSYIPDEAVKSIERDIMDRDDIPRNLPKVVKGLYHAWRQENPDKVRREQCPHGCSHGWILCYVPKRDYHERVYGRLTRDYYGHAIACPHCSPRSVATKATPEKIEEHGGMVLRSADSPARWEWDLGIAPKPTGRALMWSPARLKGEIGDARGAA